MGLKGVLKYLEEVAYTWGIRSVTKLGMVTPPDITEDEMQKNREIEKAAKKFHERLTSPRWEPSLKQVIQFNAQKTFLTTPQAETISHKDYRYYLLLKHRDYHTDVGMNPFKKLMGKLVALVVKARSS